MENNSRTISQSSKNSPKRRIGSSTRVKSVHNNCIQSSRSTNRDKCTQTRSNSRKDMKTKSGRNGKTQSDSSPSKMPSCTVVDVDNVVSTDESEEEHDGLIEMDIAEEGIGDRGLGICECILTFICLLLVLLLFPVSVWFCVKVVHQHERAVIFRLGRLLPGRAKGPGLFFFIPCLDIYHKVDMRVTTLGIPFHEVISKDMMLAEVNACCYYRVENASLSLTSVINFHDSLSLLVQTFTKRSLAHRKFNEILLERKNIGDEIKVALDAVTWKWGIKVEHAEIKDIRLPAELQHSLAVEAEAHRKAKAKVIAAEAEKDALEALKNAADVLTGCPAAVQLRYLQTLSGEKSSTVILPLPYDVLNTLSTINQKSLETTAATEPIKPTLSQEQKFKPDSPML
ncbi:podocin-like [Amblyraja radiata]|uniref:podocin-like n=1 Tax=Amblyraja radiata TaxID=386614 RepID=UPI0014036709|nr:podocin-like [Amblyraja radiata]